MQDGSEFVDVGFLHGSGSGPTWVLYELYDHGSLVLNGSVGVQEIEPWFWYLGFSGGGFDEIRVWDVGSLAGNCLILDSIETAGTTSAVPEPAALLVWSGLGAIGAVMAYRRKRRAA